MSVVMVRFCRIAALSLMGTLSLAAQRTVGTTAPPPHVAGNDIAAQRMLARPVTLNLDRVTLRHAVNAVAAQAQVRILYLGSVVDAVRTPVSLHVSQVPLGTVLDRLLQGLPLQATPLAENVIAIDPVAGAALARSGTVAGTVRDSKTKNPIAQATVLLDDASHGVSTDENGAFRLAEVSPGTHTVLVRRVGYGKSTMSVQVADGQVATLEVLLTPSTNVLDQVVVTGTVVQTELKAVPNAITVMTAKQIEERGITKIDQLFHGDVPGVSAARSGSSSSALLDEVVMFSRGATALSDASAVKNGTTSPIKTYIDGVELADPTYLSQIDPKSIERIEILTGPQASTIYGSNAINGVMNIFTKRGTSNMPQLSLSLLSGYVENNFSSARTPQHDYSAQLSGVEGRLSYNAGGSWDYMGPWTPAKQLTRTGGFGGARLNLPTRGGGVTVDMNLRRSITQSRQHGDEYQTVTGYRETGWFSPSSSTGLSVPTTRTLTGQTIGLALTYTPVSWWSHELGVGQDASDTETRVTARGYTSIADTTLSLQQSHTDRRSLRYATTARVPVAAFAQATITAGADAWQNLVSSWSISPQTLTGALTGTTRVSRQPGHNAGGFLQSQLGITDRLFLTYGLRAEWNPNFGADAQPNYAPRYGAALTQDLGPMTVKLRGSYGRSTRPPQPGFQAARTSIDAYGPSTYFLYIAPYYAPFNDRLANPDLTPEDQQGGEGGVELYLGTRGSLVVTRYNQTVDGLIAIPAVDSVRSLVVCPAYTGPGSPECLAYSRDADGYGYVSQYQYLNIGTIRNQGWELQGSLNTGPFTTHGTYSWTKSRTIGVNPKYRAYFANQPQYHLGATFGVLPEHTWALGVSYSKASSSVGLNLMGTGRVRSGHNDLYLQSFPGSIRLPQNRRNVTFPPYVSSNSGYALADLTASHQFLSRVEGVVQVQNLANRYINDYDATNASLGRQVQLGARVR